MASPASLAPSTESLSPQLIGLILNSSAESAPPGVTPDWNNPTNLHVYLWVTLILGLVLTTLAMAMRIFTKWFIIRSVGWDDYTAIISWALFVAFSAEIFVALPLVGIHTWDETVGEVFSLLYTSNNVEIIYVPAILFVKISILLQYLTIFVPTRSSNLAMFYGVHLVLWSNIVFYIVEMFFDIFTCNPRALIWDQLLDGTCYDVNKILMSIAIFNLVSDVIILLLPQYSIWRLHMSRKRKLGVSAIFGLGLLACVVTGLRVWSTVQLIQTQDVSWYLGGLALWAIAEISLAIISSSLPVLPKLIQALKRRLSKRGSSAQSYGYDAKSSQGISNSAGTHSSHEKPGRPSIGSGRARESGKSVPKVTSSADDEFDAGGEDAARTARYAAQHEV